MTGAKGLILASSSAARARLLKDAGVPAEAVPPRIDEDAAKRGLRADGIDGIALAERLAEEKARSIDEPGRLVLGADQVLLLGSRVFDKPADRAEAAAQLAALGGRTHRLASAASIVEDGVAVWRQTGEACLTMRKLGADFIETYLDRIGEAAFGGARRLSRRRAGDPAFRPYRRRPRDHSRLAVASRSWRISAAVA